MAAAQDFDKGNAAYQAGDYQTALREWMPLAQQGYARVQHNIALMYGDGLGVAQDYFTAAKWYRRAAAQGEARSQSMLGLSYALGYGVPKNNISAHMWLNISAVNGGAEAAAMRDKTAAYMSGADISLAQQRAKVCLETNYLNCD